MKPAAFKYIEVAEEGALATVLAESGADARLIAGGQSLVPMMNFRIVSPTVLIDLNRIKALSHIDCSDDTLRIGSLTRHAMIEDSEEISRRCPILACAIRYVAHRAVRNRGTTGGSLALAYPGAEIPLVLMTLSADVRLNSRAGERILAMKDFVFGALDTALASDEYIRGVEIRLPPKNSAASFIKTSRRHGDFALAAAAVVATCDPQGCPNYLRVGVSGGTGAPIRLGALEDALTGEAMTDTLLSEAAREAIAGIDVFGDHHYPEDYRRHILHAVLYSALVDALKKAGAFHVQ